MLRAKAADATEESKIDDEQNVFIGELKEKYLNGLESIERYHLACETGRREAALISGKQSFEIDMKVVRTTLDSDNTNVQRIASVVKEDFLKNYEKLLTIEKDFVDSLDKNIVFMKFYVLINYYCGLTFQIS